MVLDIATMLDIEDPQVELHATAWESLIDHYREKRRAADQANVELGATARETVRELRDAGMSMRDVAALMGISPGRVAQLG